MDEDEGRAREHRPAPGTRAGGDAGPRPGRHGPPGRPRRRQGHLPDQPGRRGHPVRVRRRRGRHLRALPGAAARGAAAVLPVPGPRLPRRQRQRVHQPPRRGAAREAARRALHQVPRPPLQRQRAGRGQDANVVRRWFGHDHIPQRFAPEVNRFAQGTLSPFLNFHRPACSPPSTATAAAGSAASTSPATS